MIYQDITKTIGSTPVIKIKSFDGSYADIFVKAEFFNPGSSAKDRAALCIIKGMIERGQLKKGDVIVEATSGNMGIGLAMCAAAMGYKAEIFMPENMSDERKKILKAYGAHLNLTPAKDGMAGSIKEAEKLACKPGYVMAKQFENPDNAKASYLTTAAEIMEDFADGLDAVVAGVGTGGTISGIGKALKEKGMNTMVVAVEPAASAVLSGGKAGPHGIQGIGAGFVPKIYDSSVVDKVIAVTDDEAVKEALDCGKTNGILLGISGGAALAAAKKIAKQLGKNKKVLFIAPDNGERYLSSPLYS